jgi:hypothetical protein
MNIMSCTVLYVQIGNKLDWIMQLDILPLIFTCPQNALSAPGNLLKMTAKRYSTKESVSNVARLTLVFGHGVGGCTSLPRCRYLYLREVLNRQGAMGASD